MERFDVAVVGAGAAGLYCAGIAGQRGLRVVVLDHARKLAEKIRISGGGRCNFTNRAGADPARYLSEDPGFARTALAAHPPEAFIAAVRARGIGFHEKHRGQLFCDDSSQRIIDLLLDGCARGRVSVRHPVDVRAITCPAGAADDRRAPRFELETTSGRIAARHLVVATGGQSIPAIGASDFGWRLAAAWGLRTVAARAGLVPFTITDPAWAPFAALSGLSLPVRIGVAAARPGHAVAPDSGPAGGVAATTFTEDLLLTHRGLSGPAALQISSYWHPGMALSIDLLPDVDAGEALAAIRSGRSAGSRAGGVRGGGGVGPGAQLVTALGAWLPRRLAVTWAAACLAAADPAADRSAGIALPSGEDRLSGCSEAALRRVGRALSAWTVRPAGTEGYRKAEVTAGGVATAELDPLTLESAQVPGSHWIGEVVDVTGWLGGYNFQWAWASGHAVAQAIGHSR